MPPISTPMATATNAALNRITCYLLVPGRPGMLPTARLSAVWAEAADVLGDRVLSRRGRRACRSTAQRGLAEADRELRRSWLRRRWHSGERPAIRDAGLKVAELALQVRLEPAAVLALERAEVVHPALEFLALGDQRTHRLAVALLRVPLQRLGPGPGVTSDLLRLAAGLGEYLVGLAACPAERLVRLAAGGGDPPVGSLLGKREHASRRVHVVLGVIRPVHHHGLGPPHRLLHGRLWRHRVRPRVRQRRAQRHGRLPPATQDLGQLGPELFVLLDQPVKLSLNLVEEGVNFFLVVAGPEPGRTELLVPHIRGRQRHLVSSARLAVFLRTVLVQHRTWFKVAAQPPVAKSVPR